jgi:hypothetical protein
MLDRHTLAYTVLAAVHVATAALVALDGALAHATCALIAALAYGALCCPSLRHPKVGSPEQ